MRYTPRGIIQFATSYTPAEGPGARISPSTYAEDAKQGHPAGPAFSPSTPIRTLDEKGNVILGEDAMSVVIDSLQSQITRTENALWDLRDELDLSGIVIREGDENIIKNEVEKKLKAKKLDKDFSVEDIYNHYKENVNLHDDFLSSWTVSHRHVDGNIRLASIDPEGKKEMWKSKNMDGLYGRISRTSSSNMKELLTLSPNLALYGFWLSSGALTRHRESRNYGYEINAYDAHRVYYGATKLSHLPTSSQTQYKRDADGVFREAKKGIKPSEALLGSVPAFSTSTVTARNILGTGSLKAGKLWSTLGKDHHITREQREAAFDALMSLAMLGASLAADVWTLRSGCTLIPEESFVTEIAGAHKTRHLDTLDTEVLLDQAKEDIIKAQKVDIFGGAKDREVLYFSPSLASISLDAFLSEATKAESKE